LRSYTKQTYVYYFNVYCSFTVMAVTRNTGPDVHCNEFIKTGFVDLKV